ncbi:hypothetical protein L211DRAFT_900161 [Terfezia boudieri ATCC MYA-4762]|uniref:Uncharacterized protein n=1 Tax=Terfezia boudieri ATCC MYA-4762 TaxID=1051890 RepID=A0A3N4LBK2_9PEZI|nr:hypothetical protein L211DRAFT_900161 [Terfezia boudieri ATCC MYA-4762]
MGMNTAQYSYIEPAYSYFSYLTSFERTPTAIDISSQLKLLRCVSDTANSGRESTTTNNIDNSRWLTRATCAVKIRLPMDAGGIQIARMAWRLILLTSKELRSVYLPMAILTANLNNSFCLIFPIHTLDLLSFKTENSSLMHHLPLYKMPQLSFLLLILVLTTLCYFTNSVTASDDNTCPEPAVMMAHRTRAWELFLSAVCSMLTGPTQMLVAFLFRKYAGETELEKKTRQWEDDKTQLNQEKVQLQQDNLRLEQQNSELAHGKSILERQNSDLEQEIARLKEEREGRQRIEQQISHLKEEREKEIQKIEQQIAMLKEEREKEMEQQISWLKEGHEKEMQRKEQQIVQMKEGHEKEMQRKEQQITQMKEGHEKEMQRKEQQITQMKEEHYMEWVKTLVERNRERELLREHIDREKSHGENLQRLLDSMMLDSMMR